MGGIALQCRFVQILNAVQLVRGHFHPFASIRRAQAFATESLFYRHG